MFEPDKPRYLTRGVDEKIPPELQLFLWTAVDEMPDPKDYLQVFLLENAHGLQSINHSSEEPEFHMTYVLPMIEDPITDKVYVIDSDEYCTMLLAEEY